MGILEITLLRLKEGTRYTDPTLLSNLQSIRSQLGTNSRFFVGPSTHDHASILILGTWPSLQAHNDFLNSKDRIKVLGPQEDQTRFIWSVHADLGEGKGMEALRLDARRAISVARLSTLETEKSSIEEAYQKYMERVAKKTEGEFITVFNDWVIDPEEETRERIVILGRDDLRKTISDEKEGPERGLRAELHFENAIVREEFGYDLEDEATRSDMAETKIEGSG